MWDCGFPAVDGGGGDTISLIAIIWECHRPTAVPESDGVRLSDGVESSNVSNVFESSIFSPSSDRQFWSTLRSRVDSLLENRKPTDQSLPVQMNDEALKRQKRLKEDSMLLLRWFDSVSHSQSLENALQGAKDLARPPTLIEILHSTLEKAKSEENKLENENKEEEKEEAEKESEEINKGSRRMLDSPECTQQK